MFGKIRVAAWRERARKGNLFGAATQRRHNTLDRMRKFRFPVALC